MPILLPGTLFAALFIWYTLRKKALTVDGALSAAAVGLWVLAWAGPLWLLPLFFFFISGTLLGRLNKNRIAASDAKHGQPRDYRQVLCNGGIYAALATWAAGPDAAKAISLMTLTMAVSTADTWSSEIGQYFRQKTVDIWRWRPVPVGLSGGVSWAGTAGGLLGGLALSVCCSVLIFKNLNIDFVFRCAIGGFAGMLLDSLLGALVQARYRDPATGILSDRAGEGRVPERAWALLDNDGVNLWSNLLVTLGGYWWLL